MTGVCGYIGAHVAEALINKGHSVIGFDNLSTGRPEFIDPEITFVRGDVRNQASLKKAFSRLKAPSVSGVIHCAGVKFPSESFLDPIKYFEINSLGTLNVLKVMDAFKVPNLVFSSSCSVYGQPREPLLVDESTELNPISPYGYSKKIAEEFIEQIKNLLGIKAVSLRYFNVAGNSHNKAFDRSFTNIMPNLYRSATQKNKFEIFGLNYKTEDGSCVRDYIHVQDLANVHVTAIEKLMLNCSLRSAYNLGSNSGFSVLQIVEEFKLKCFTDFEFEVKEQRLGDPAYIVANSQAAKSELDWNPILGLSEIIKSGWQAWQKNVS